jgi:hypothetical protein
MKVFASNYLSVFALGLSLLSAGCSRKGVNELSNGTESERNANVPQVNGHSRQDEVKDNKIDKHTSLAGVRDMKMSELIDGLANRNPVPELQKGDRAPVFPSDYDWKEQARVIETWRAIEARVPDDARESDALSQLVSHVGDERYSLTHTLPAGEWTNSSVGGICGLILVRKIQCFDFPPGDLKFHFLPYEPDEVQKWWSERKDRSLPALQLEAIAGARSELLAGPRNDVPAEIQLSESQRSRMLDDLNELEQEIRSSKRAIPRRALTDALDFKNWPLPKSLK